MKLFDKTSWILTLIISLYITVVFQAASIGNEIDIVKAQINTLREQQNQMLILLAKDYPDEEIIHAWKLKHPKMEK